MNGAQNCRNKLVTPLPKIVIQFQANNEMLSSVDYTLPLLEASNLLLDHDVLEVL